MGQNRTTARDPKDAFAKGYEAWGRANGLRYGLRAVFSGIRCYCWFLGSYDIAVRTKKYLLSPGLTEQPRIQGSCASVQDLGTKMWFCLDLGRSGFSSAVSVRIVMKYAESPIPPLIEENTFNHVGDPSIIQGICLYEGALEAFRAKHGANSSSGNRDVTIRGLIGAPCSEPSRLC